MLSLLYPLLPLAHAQGVGTVQINPNIPGSIPINQGPIAVVMNMYQYALMFAGLLVFGSIVWAGIRYAMAAGNPSTQSDARDQIWQALLGLVLLLGSYVILFTINPDLVRFSLPALEKIGLIQSGNVGDIIDRGGGIGGGGDGGGGTCNQLGGPLCSVSQLEAAGCRGNSRCSGANALANLAAVLSFDSSGCSVASRESRTDVCQGGDTFSLGMLQVNLLWHANAWGGQCSGLVQKVSGAQNCNSNAGICVYQGNGLPSQSCAQWTTNSQGVRYCSLYHCRVMNRQKYEACKASISGNVDAQRRYACQLYNRNCYSDWTYSACKCNVISGGSCAQTR